MTVNENQCSNCGCTGNYRGSPASLWSYYPIRPTTAESIAAKTLLCNKCYGVKEHPHAHVSFDPLAALRLYHYVKSSAMFPYYNSVKIYAFYGRRASAWAYVTVTNGDYQDIKEPHVAWDIREGYIPVQITEDELTKFAREYWNAVKHSKYSNEYSNEYNEKLAKEIGFITDKENKNGTAI